ncbi:ATP-binding protein [Robbsia andropogonis]|uniref:ATP-binding protein n=1 Tax=Robbsia andropogonis TaxID=28092 RepID=UPI002A6ACA98|nr:ATP-binding protein [Robbsia andropogonis]
MKDPIPPFPFLPAESIQPCAPVFHLCTVATIDETARCIRALHEWLDARSPGSRHGFHAALIIDELLHNVSMHGQRSADDDPGNHTCFALWVTPMGTGFAITLHDNGIAFDPLTARPARVTPPSLDDPMGGLGLVLVKRLLHAAHYHVQNGENRLFILVLP